MLFGKDNYTGVDENTGVSLPNFEKIANAFNIPYMNTRKNTLDDFVNHDGYCIFECFMNPEQDLCPKVKGVKSNGFIVAPSIEDMSPLVPIEVLEDNMIVDLHENSKGLER